MRANGAGAFSEERPFASEGDASYYGSQPRSDLRGSPSSSSLRDLPDLTDRLIQAGIYAEYNTYRQRYLQWRKGGAQGAAGELTHSSLRESNDQSQFEYWYPTPSIFKWRYTMAYWKSIFFLIGSLLFTFNAGVKYYRPPGAGELTESLPNCVGSTLFSVGCYLGYLQMINISTGDEEKVTHMLPDWTGMIQRLQVSSVIGTLSYLLGAILFNVATVAEMWPELPRTFEITLVELANVVASLGFVLGGLCELAHNGIFAGGATWREPVFWASFANVFGGANFLAGSVPGLAVPDADGWRTMSFVYFNFFVGSAFFILSSALMIVMWRANDFGLTLLRQLNFALNTNGFLSVARPNGSNGREQIGVRFHVTDEAARPSLESAGPQNSLRGAFFIIVYCWFTFVAIVNCLFRAQEFAHAEERIVTELVIDLAMQVFVVVVIALVLVIHSVVTEVPDEQPYFCALVCTRAILVVGAFVQTVSFVRFIKSPTYTVAGPTGTQIVPVS